MTGESPPPLRPTLSRAATAVRPGARFPSASRAALVLVAALGTGCSSPGSGPSGVSDEAVDFRGEAVAALAPFDSAVASAMRAHGITGAALAVTRNGRVLYERGYTHVPTAEDVPVEPASLFRIASISKPITAVAVLELAERGSLALSDRLVDHLDLQPLPGETVDPRLGDVTIRHLLEHLGGWDREASFDPMFHDLVVADALGRSLPVARSDIVAYMNGRPLQHDPGATYAYSNYGYLLLGRVIEAASGLDYETFVRNAVLAPLGITEMRTGRSLLEDRQPNEVAYHAPGTAPSVFEEGASAPWAYGAWNIENMDAHGGWLAAAGDLARFAASFDDPDANPVLERASIEAMFGLPGYLDPGTYQAGSAYYGLGWAVRDWGSGGMNTWHGGSLPGTYTLMVRRRDGVGWVVLFNRRTDGIDAIDGALHGAADAVGAWPGG